MRPAGGRRGRIVKEEHEKQSSGALTPRTYHTDLTTKKNCPRPSPRLQSASKRRLDSGLSDQKAILTKEISLLRHIILFVGVMTCSSRVLPDDLPWQPPPTLGDRTF